jgi:hypothetical protein
MCHVEGLVLKNEHTEEGCLAGRVRIARGDCMKYVAGFVLLLVLFGMVTDLGPGYVLEALVAILPALAAGLASAYVIQWALGRWYRLKSSAVKASRVFAAASALVSVAAGAGIALLTLGAPRPFGHENPDIEYILTVVLFFMSAVWLTRRFNSRLEASCRERAEIKSRIEKKKSDIVGMINRALSGEGAQPALAAAGPTRVNIAKGDIVDNEWRDIRHGDLPSWIKRRIEELDHRQLAGRKFEYRRAPDGGYQRKLR